MIYIYTACMYISIYVPKVHWVSLGDFPASACYLHMYSYIAKPLERVEALQSICIATQSCEHRRPERKEYMFKETANLECRYVYKYYIRDREST